MEFAKYETFYIMPHKTRLILFYTFVILFIALGGIVLAYSYGWRIDFETGKVQKIGAIYVKANVRDVTIKINNKEYKDESGILQSGTLISNLLPKTYRIEVTKDGYLPYHKTLTVQPALVEELLNVQLIPTTFEPTVIAPTKGTTFIDATESADRMILKDTSTGIHYLHTKTNASSTVNLTMAVSNAKRGQKIKRIAFIPFKPTQFVIEDATGFKLFDSEKKTIETLYKGSIVAWTMRDSTMIHVETNTKTRAQEIFTFSLIFKTKTSLNDLNTEIPKTTYLTQIDATSNLATIAFSDVENGLFLFTPKEKKLKHIAENIHSFTFSPDNKKLLIKPNSGNPSVLFIEDFDGDIRKKEGDMITIALPQTDTVKTIEWYGDSYHLLVEHPSKLVITELDDRTPLNIFPLASNFIDYRYSAKEKTVYYTHAKELLSIRIER